MLKAIARTVLLRLGVRAVKARTFDAARARARELEELVAALGAENRHFRDENARLAAAQSRQAVETAEAVRQAADTRQQLTQVRADRAAALDQLAQVQKTLTPPPPPPAAPVESEHDAGYWTRLGVELEAAGDTEAAVARYARAMQLIPLFTAARERLAGLSKRFAAEADDHRAAGRIAEEKRALVRAAEMAPSDKSVRARLDAVIAADTRFDVTESCGNYQDQARGRAVFREAFLRVCEYLSGSGVVGEFFEFGVYGGFTARIQAEIIRDLEMWREIHLFDSFEGLPTYEAAPDLAGYDTAVRNVWSTPLKHEDWFVRDYLGCPVDVAIYRRITEIVAPNRVFIYRGFFSETLARLPAVKAALVHVDSDIYSSAREVLAGLYERDMYQDGCVLMFDDWNCFRANPAFGERRAFREFLEGQTRYTATPFFTYGWCGAAFILHDTTVGAGV